MPRAKTSRKALFKAALAIAGTTQDQWCEKEGLSVGHLSLVLAGKRESRSLTDRVDAFIKEHVGGGQLSGRSSAVA